jgi:hypothetical protein
MTQWVLAFMSTVIATCATLANFIIAFLHWKNNKYLERYRQIILFQINRLAELLELLPNLHYANELSHNGSLFDAIHEHNEKVIASFAKSIETAFEKSEKFYDDHQDLLGSSGRVLLERNLKNINQATSRLHGEATRLDLTEEGEGWNATWLSLCSMKYAFAQQLFTEVYAELEEIGKSLSSAHQDSKKVV